MLLDFVRFGSWGGESVCKVSTMVRIFLIDFAGSRSSPSSSSWFGFGSNPTLSPCLAAERPSQEPLTAFLLNKMKQGTIRNDQNDNSRTHITIHFWNVNLCVSFFQLKPKSRIQEIKKDRDYEKETRQKSKSITMYQLIHLNIINYKRFHFFFLCKALALFEKTKSNIFFLNNLTFLREEVFLTCFPVEGATLRLLCNFFSQLLDRQNMKETWEERKLWHHNFSYFSQFSCIMDYQFLNQ